jgi:hypothetical protein
VDGLVPIGDKTFTDPSPKLDLSVKAQRRNADHVRFSIDTERPATITFGGVCRSAGKRLTGLNGTLTVTVRHSRRGSCPITASRDAWQPATRSFKLRKPRR